MTSKPTIRAIWLALPVTRVSKLRFLSKWLFLYVVSNLVSLETAFSVFSLFSRTLFRVGGSVDGAGWFAVGAAVTDTTAETPRLAFWLLLSRTVNCTWMVLPQYSCANICMRWPNWREHASALIRLGAPMVRLCDCSSNAHTVKGAIHALNCCGVSSFCNWLEQACQKSNMIKYLLINYI